MVLIYGGEYQVRLYFFFCSIQTGSPPFTEAAHTIYGIPQTINSANYMYFLALQELISLPMRRPQVACKAKDSVVDIVTSTFVFYFIFRKSSSNVLFPFVF